MSAGDCEQTFVFLKAPLLYGGAGQFVAGHRAVALGAPRALLKDLFLSAASPGQLESTGPGRPLGDDLVATLSRRTPPEGYDFAFLEQGYGGVYVHTYELVRRLRAKYRVLLLAPVDPLFEKGNHPDDWTGQALHLGGRPLSFLSYVSLVRNILQRVRIGHLVIAHRSHSLYAFDLLSGIPTTIYCDGYYDALLYLAGEMGAVPSAGLRDAILNDVYYHLGNSSPEFYGLNAHPLVNLRVLQAGWLALQAARNNWCWGAEQVATFNANLPSRESPAEWQLPFISRDIYNPSSVRRGPRVLFTTTMHNIEKKGYLELARVSPRLPASARIVVVVRQAGRLPRTPPAWRERMRFATLPKASMLQLYHKISVNCRVSREESSPVSILESMLCGVPQVVSTVVARQIPFLEDGETGFVVDPDDSDGLLRGLSRILSNDGLRERLGREARRRAERHCLERRIDMFEPLLRQTGSAEGAAGNA